MKNMGADKNYRVLLIEPLYQCEYEDGKKIDKFFLNINIELKSWQYMVMATHITPFS